MSSRVIYEYKRPSGEAVVFTLMPGRYILVHVANEVVDEGTIDSSEGSVDAAALRFAKNWQATREIK